MIIIGGVLDFVIDFAGMTILVVLSVASLVLFGWIWPLWWVCSKLAELIPESLSPLGLLLVVPWAVLTPFAGLSMVSVLILAEILESYPRIFRDLVWTLKAGSRHSLH